MNRLETLALVLLLAAGGCGTEGGQPLAPAVPANGTGAVGPAGGSVSLGQEAGVIVPAGALDETVTISIQRTATPAELAVEGGLGQAYRFLPSGQAFLLPVEIFLFVTDAALEGYDPASLRLHITTESDGVNAAAEPLPGIRTEPTTGGVTIHGTTTHFSTVSATADLLPLADAGPDRSVPVGARVEVTGVGSDPQGGEVSLAWSFASRPPGSGAALTTTGSATAEFTPAETGDYELELTVTSGTGATATDRILITAIDDAGGAPTADAGPDLEVDRNALVTLDGSGSSGAPPLAFAWRFLEFPGAHPVLAGKDTPEPSFTPVDGGTYVLELTVTNQGGSSIDTVTINVNSPPAVQLNGPEGVKAGESVSVSGTWSDPDGDSLDVVWSLAAPSGSSASLTGSGATRSFITDVIGFYAITLAVDDGRETTVGGFTVGAVPDVSGEYLATFTIDAAPGCGLDEPEVFGPGPLPITQDGAEITMQVEEISDGQVSNIRGPIRPDGSFDFFAALQVERDGDTFTLTPHWTGRFEASGDLEADFTVLVFTCTLTGSLSGTHQ